MEAVFYAAPERDLLRGFWSAVQPDDVFYGNQVFDRLGLLRRRTWAWGLIPARELDLPRVYQHRMVDTAGLPSGAGDSTFRSAEALATVLGLSGMPIGDNKH